MTLPAINRRRFVRGAGAAALGAMTPVTGFSAGKAESPGGRIKIGQIGTGHSHAAGKMEIYRESPDYEVIGIVEADAGLRAAAGKSSVYRDLRWMTEEELLNAPGLQAVAVETRVRDLLPTAGRCVDAGMHIHLDKPPGDDLEQFRNLLENASRRERTVQLGYMYRYNPAVMLMRDLLEKGWLGEPFEAHAVMSKVVEPKGRQDLTQFPGGIMFELGCHIVDLLAQTLGKPDKVTALSRHSSPEIDDGWPDNMLAVCEYPAATATLRCSALEVEGNARRHFALCGSEGTIHIQPLDRPSVRLALAKPRGDYRQGYQDITFAPYRRYVGDAADLAKVIRGEKPSDFLPEYDLAVQETVLRASGLL